MSEAAAAPAAEPKPVVPVVETPKPAKTWRDPVEAKLAGIRAKLIAPPPETAKPEAAKEPEAKKDEPAAAKDGAKPATLEETRYLKEVAKLNRELRDAKAKLREFEGGGGTGDEASKLRELYKSDKLAALAQLSGREGSDELAELLDVFYETAGAGTEAQKDKAGAAVLAKLEALTRDVEGFKAEKTERETATAAAETKRGADEFVTRFAKGREADYEIGMRAENLAEATDLVHKGVAEIVQREGIDPDDLADEDIANAVLKEAWDGAEAELIKRGERYGKKPPAPAAVEAAPSGLDKYPNLGKRNAAPAAEVVPVPKGGTFADKFEAIKARARADYKQRTGGK